MLIMAKNMGVPDSECKVKVFSSTSICHSQVAIKGAESQFVVGSICNSPARIPDGVHDAHASR